MANKAAEVKGTWRICRKRQEFLQECLIQARHKIGILYERIRGRAGTAEKRKVSEGQTHQAEGSGRGFEHAKSTYQEPSGKQDIAQRSINNIAGALGDSAKRSAARGMTGAVGGRTEKCQPSQLVPFLCL